MQVKVLVQFWLIVTAFESNIILSNCAQCIMRRGNTRLDWKWLNNTIVKIFILMKHLYLVLLRPKLYITEMKNCSEVHTSYYRFLTILRKYIQHFFWVKICLYIKNRYSYIKAGFSRVALVYLKLSHIYFIRRLMPTKQVVQYLPWQSIKQTKHIY